MKKLLAVMCMVASFSSVAATKEELNIAESLGVCAAAEFHVTGNEAKYRESYSLASDTMGKHQFVVYGIGMGIIKGIREVGENHIIVKIHNNCKAKYNM